MSPLYYAALRGDHENIEFLLDCGADVNTGHDVFGPPICIAALRGHVKVFEMLLEHKASLDVPSVLGSVMHCACFGGSVPIVDVLLKNGQTLSQTGVLSISILRMLANEQPRKWSSIVYWRQSCQNHRKRPPFLSCSPVLMALECSHDELLQTIWTGFPMSVERLNECPNHGHLVNDSRWEFDEHSASVDQKLPADTSTTSTWSFLGFSRPVATGNNSTLLMWAAASLKVEQIDLLLKAGATVNERDRSGMTALHHAASPFDDAPLGNIRAIVQRLMQAGADLPTHPTVPSPLRLIVDCWHPALDPRNSRLWGLHIHEQYITEFLDLFVSESTRREASCEALTHALFEEICPLDSIKLLCKSSAPFEGPEGLINAMLCQFIRSKRYADETIISTLLQNGANPNARIGGDTPLSIAIDCRLPYSIIEALLKYGATPVTLPHGYLYVEAALERLSRVSRIGGLKAYTLAFLGKNKPT